MSQRQSCNRCRQQKVRCLRDDISTSLTRCERCTKAGVDCIYSSVPNVVKQRSNRRSVQIPARRGTESEPRNRNGTSWFDQGFVGALYPNGPSLGSEFPDVVAPLPGVDESGVASFNGWDANLQLFSPTSLNSLTASSTVEPTPNSTAPSTTDGREESEDIDNDKDSVSALSSQLTSLSLRATRATQRVVRPGRAPLTVSSPEVNEALEDTNTLIRIMNNITAPDHDNVTFDSTTTDNGLAFSALACHQHLVALFRAICDAIHQCLQSQKESQQQHQRARQYTDVEASSVAQFVMVLRLLMHLINRMDRSLFQKNPSTWHCTGLSTGTLTEPVTPNIPHHHITDRIRSDSVVGGLSLHGGLLFFVQSIVGTIPSEHEKLRQVIQKLQTEMEQEELH